MNRSLRLDDDNGLRRARRVHELVLPEKAYRSVVAISKDGQRRALEKLTLAKQPDARRTWRRTLTRG